MARLFEGATWDIVADEPFAWEFACLIDEVGLHRERVQNPAAKAIAMVACLPRLFNEPSEWVKFKQSSEKLLS